MPRITFDVDPEIHATLCIIPHGFRKYAYRWLIEGYADYLRREPAQALSDLMSHRLDVSTLIHPGESSGRPMERKDEPDPVEQPSSA